MSVSNLFTQHHKSWQNLHVNSLTTDQLQVVDSTGNDGQRFNTAVNTALPAPENGGLSSAVNTDGDYDLHFSEGSEWKHVHSGYNYLEVGSAFAQSINSGAVTNVENWGTPTILGDGIEKAIDNDYDFTVLESGVYDVSVTITFQTNANGLRSLIIYMNGINSGHQTALPVGGGQNHRQHVCCRRFLNKDERIRIAVYQDTGGALNIWGNYGVFRLTVTRIQ